MGFHAGSPTTKDVVVWQDANGDGVDGVSDTVTTKREAMSIAWYASAGTLDTESTGRAEDDPTLSTDNGYATPITAGPAHVWVVLRDSRGGVDFADVPVDVTP
jgi:hypothetical protein